jgi:eukaryotic-like serine/threonine-protein kinase
MSKKVGRFEILSEIQRGDTISVYKASDPDAGRIVALKTIRLDVLGEQGQALVDTVLAETQACQILNSHNIALLYSTERIEDMLCASLEYVQGNSVGTMLARNEGFSIWDLQDIARQSCQGLDHAASHKVFHYALEPAKIMVQWDGIAKVLGYGISSTGLHAVQAQGKPPQILHYMSPEQVRGDPIDARSNLFSLGTILYEMITERKAFGGEDADQVRRAILESAPTQISQINPSVHEALEAVVMKVLAKDPQERYQSGQDLIADLEKCKSGAAKASPRKPVAASAAKPAQAAQSEVSRAAAASQGGPSTASLASPVVSVASSAPVQDREELTSFADPETSAAAAAVVDDRPEVETPRFATDPLVGGSRPAEASRESFSDINELPPLKEVYVAADPPPPPPPDPEPADQVKAVVFNRAEVTKPKTPPREIARQAVKEIKGTPPRLFLYAMGAAVAVILAVMVGIAYRIHAGESDDFTPPVEPAAETRVTAPAPPPAQVAQPAPPAPAPAKVPAQVIPKPPVEKQPVVSVRPKYNSKKLRAKLLSPRSTAPAIVPGQLIVDSYPAGAVVSIDGQNQAVTPLSLSNLPPGRHSITISKAGFASETRAVDVASGSKSSISIQLAPTTATVAADSDPAGAAIWVDGRDSGRVTPARISLDKPGSHNFVFKKAGYLDETMSANVQIGQTFQMAPKLRALGSTDEIKVGGRFKKVFGGSETAGMGTVSVRTQPKGAQIAVNNHLLDKMSPVEFYLNPGNYVIDITLSGFKTVEKVITVEKNGKLMIDENLDRQ